MGLKKIKMTTTELVLPANSGIKHVATSWQISKSTDFDTLSNIVAESLNDRTNLLEYSVSIEIDDNAPLYGRHMMHITKDGTALEATWSRICPFNSNMKGLKINNFLINTPKLIVKSEESNIDATGNEFSMFSGTGTHSYTSWAVKSTYGEDVFVRKNDRSNLTNLHLSNIVEPNKGYSIECKYGNEFNNESFATKELLLNYSKELNLFKMEFPEEFIIDRKFYYKIKIYTQDHIRHDIEIRDSDGNVVKSKYESNDLVGYFMLDDMNVYSTYSIYARIKFETGLVSRYTKLYTGMLLPNRITPYKPFIQYLGMFDKGPEYQTDGFACVTTRETYDGKVFLPSFEGNTLYLYKAFTNSLQKLNMVALKDVYNYQYNANIDHINIVQLPNHDIVIDMVSYDSEGHKYTKFYKFEYNPITMKLTNYGELERPKEQYCTALCNSLGVLKDNTLIYIPGFYSETMDEVRSNLPLITVGVTDNAMYFKDQVTLPFNAKYNVSLVVDKDDNVFVFGGSETNTYDPENKNSEYWLRSNNSVYLYNVENKTFTEVAQLPDEWPIDAYALQPFLRQDGKIVIFNGSHSGPGLKNQNHLVFDPETYTFTIINTDIDWDIPFRSNVLYTNGNVGRISYKVKDPQKSYTYISNTKDEKNITKIEGTDSDVTDLIVDSGTVVNVEDLYPYDTVKINGTGVLRWFRPQGIIELTSSDLIITRDTNITQTQVDEGRYHNILVLEGVDFKINND